LRAAHREKVAEHCAAFLRQHTACDYGMVIQAQPLPSPPLVRGGSELSSPDKGRPGGVELPKRIHHTAARAGLGVACAVYDPRDARVRDRSGVTSSPPKGRYFLTFMSPQPASSEMLARPAAIAPIDIRFM